MRPLLLTVLILLSSLVVTAQNTMFVSFQQDYEMLLTQLKEIQLLEIVSENEDKQILVHYGESYTTYDFNQGQLYKVTMSKKYDRKKSAHSAIKGTLDYFNIIKANVVYFFITSKSRHYVAVSSGKVFELTMTANSNEDIDVVLISKNVATTPDHDKTNFEKLSMKKRKQKKKNLSDTKDKSGNLYASLETDSTEDAESGDPFVSLVEMAEAPIKQEGNQLKIEKPQELIMWQNDQFNDLKARIQSVQSRLDKLNKENEE